MTTRNRLGLHDSFRVLAFQAALSGGEVRRLQLSHGARLAVRVRGATVELTIARPEKPVGDVELQTFRAHCGIPGNAIRTPETGQATREERGKTWHLVTFTWTDEKYLRPANVPGRGEGGTIV